jgi:hypothetical protein
MPASTVLGTVTKTNGGSLPYTSRFGDGGTAGSFKSVRDAQIPIEAAQGGRLLRWTRSDLAGDIEFYYAERP